ncbi:MAG TPA: PilZ domain-containing protein [Nitrospira sp.]|nr:PilZ domain-containing protein [Nitrospira sp.]
MKPRNGDRYLEQEFMRPDYLNNESIKKVSATLDRREADRVSIYAHVSYASDDDASVINADGQLLNLSKLGCRIVGPSPNVGSHMTISLDLNDGKAPLRLAGATVCWCDGYSFGTKFSSMTGEERQRLQELVLKLASRHRSTDDYTAFRLA